MLPVKILEPFEPAFCPPPSSLCASLLVMVSEAKTGLKINATKSEPDSVMPTVMGRYFKNSPMMPGIQSTGAKCRDRGERGGKHRHHDLSCAVKRRLETAFSHLQMPVDVFHHHDAVVDQHAERP